jgi:midasin (ATPase involved in ribosome maturation)
VKVQLGDQTDSRMLLGSYRCTDVPGEFVWQPGVLTQVRKGVILIVVLICITKFPNYPIAKFMYLHAVKYYFVIAIVH